MCVGARACAEFVLTYHTTLHDDVHGVFVAPHPTPPRRTTVPRRDTRRPFNARVDGIKCADTKRMCKLVAMNAYPRLWKSQIKAVLMETNYTLADAMERLSAIDREYKDTWLVMCIGRVPWHARVRRDVK